MGTDGKVIIRSQIDGPFRGFDANTVFKLTDGTYWLQAAEQYSYVREDRPEVEIIREGDRNLLRLAGTDETVPVVRLSIVIVSQIYGEFEGWQGGSRYGLTNGQVWKQARYKFHYKYAYEPQVLIYDAPQGTMMDVEGCRAVVRRLR